MNEICKRTLASGCVPDNGMQIKLGLLSVQFFSSQFQFILAERVKVSYTSSIHRDTYISRTKLENANSKAPTRLLDKTDYI